MIEDMDPRENAPPITIPRYLTLGNGSPVVINESVPLIIDIHAEAKALLAGSHAWAPAPPESLRTRFQRSLRTLMHRPHQSAAIRSLMSGQGLPRTERRAAQESLRAALAHMQGTALGKEQEPSPWGLDAW